MSELAVRSLSRSFPGYPDAVRDVTFTVAEGRTAALLGPSGCGKTSLLRLIAGLDHPDRGDVLVDGGSVLDRPPERRGIGLMFQDLALFPHMSVAENIAFGLRMAGWPRERRRERVRELLRLIGLVGLGDRAVDQLSGGERQRVTLARTLAPEPAVVLLDEPLGALDEPLKRALREDLRAVLRELGTTAIVVSHDLVDAVAVADDLLIMREGRILQDGALPDVLGQPVSAQVAEMLGYVGLLNGEVREGTAIEVGVGMLSEVEAGALPPSGPVRILAHPDSLLALPAGQGMGSGVRGPVVGATPDGPQFRVVVQLGDREISARWEWDLGPPPLGTAVEVVARPGTLRVYPGVVAPVGAEREPSLPPGDGTDDPATEATDDSALRDGTVPDAASGDIGVDRVPDNGALDARALADVSLDDLTDDGELPAYDPAPLEDALGTMQADTRRSQGGGALGGEPPGDALDDRSPDGGGNERGGRGTSP